MSLDPAAIGTAVDDFFNSVEDIIGDEATSKALPLIGALDALPAIEALQTKLEAFRQQIHNAIASATDPDVAQAVVDAINTAGIAGITAAKTAEGGVELAIHYTDTVDTGSAALDLGNSVGPFLDLTVNAGASILTDLAVTLAFAEDGTFSLKDQVNPELVVDISADLSITDLTAKLGVVDVTVTDSDPLVPEVTAHFALDLASGAGGTITADPTLSADINLDLDFKSSNLLAGLLPDVSGKLLVDFGLVGDTFADPSVTVQEVKLDLDSYLDIVGDAAGEIGKLFKATPFDQLIKVATAPIPVLDSLAHKFGLVGLFDKVGGLTGDGDNKITIGDLAAYSSSEAEAIIDAWYRIIAIVDILRKVDSYGDLGSIDIGGGSLIDGVTTPSNDPAAILTALKDKLADLGLPSEVTDFLSDFEITGLDKAASGGDPFTFGLLEHPEDILKLLLTDDPVDLVKFDVPALEFSVQAGGFFPVLGPLGFELSGALKATVDFDIGYDSQGLITGNIFDGFFLTTALDNPLRAPNLSAYEPVGSLETSLTGGAGIGYAGSSLTVNARFDFGLYAYFEDSDGDGKFRPTSDELDCIFDPVGGSAGVSANLTIKIGFGPFSVKKNFTLASASLGDFNVFKCPPPTVVPTPEAPGLATESGADLLLNVGPRSDLRKLVDEHDGVAKFIVTMDDPDTAENESLNEGYVISRARNTVSDSLTGESTTALVAGKLDVTAFGFTQRVNDGLLIKADFGDGNDYLVIQDDVTNDSVISGGAGEDTLIGGAGKDILAGNDDSDTLSGSAGDDVVLGGKGDDQLSGGKGGDLIDGGEGIDTVDFSEANRDVGVGVTISLVAGTFVGSGGEATGDTYANVENIVGTDFNDFISASGAAFSVFLEGGNGSDVLIGGTNNDLLLGSQGADGLYGGAGEDGTTYITSWAGVDVDLTRFFQYDGDAQGDFLISIEDIQGTIFDDRLLGGSTANVLDAGDGNDTLDGRGGVDTITAGAGNDRVFARADNDYLDGGQGIDTLSYERVVGPVTVDLGASQLTNGSFIGGSAPDRIVMAFAVDGGARGYSSFENLIGTGAGDSLTGDLRSNRIEGRGGSDFISGDQGNDYLIGGAGGDFLVGGDGFDWVEYGDSNAAVTVDLLSGGVGGTAAGDVFLGVENILGSRYADALLGTDGANIIDTSISGLANVEGVDGRGGTDTLRLDYSGVEADVVKGVIGGILQDESGIGILLRYVDTGPEIFDRVDFTHIERLSITGTRSDDVLVGARGDDIFVTQGGNDTVFSGTGADTVLAGRGNDIVAYGTKGLELTRNAADEPFKLDGGAGIDTLSISLSESREDIAIGGGSGDFEFSGANLKLATGGSARNFELLGDVWTGFGDDVVLQLGRVDNDFKTGDGNDIIFSGLGHDTIDGGLNTTGFTDIFYGEGGIPTAYVSDAEAIHANAGDLLVLDFSSLDADHRVVSYQNLTQSLTAVTSYSEFDYQQRDPIFTNYGGYATIAIATYGAATGPVNIPFPDDAQDTAYYINIERLNVTGSQQNDYITGSDNIFSAGVFDYAYEKTAAQGGNDILSGLGGDDQIFGGAGSDEIYGGDGDDFLQGSEYFSNSYFYTGNFNVAAASAIVIGPSQPEDIPGVHDRYEVDVLTGGTGADTFVAGVEHAPLYWDTDNYNSYLDRAQITDFDASEGDVIQLHGSADQYRIEETVDGSTIFFRDGIGELADRDELIAEVQDVFDLDLTSDAFVYVGGNANARLSAPATIAAPLPDLPQAKPAILDLEALTKIAEGAAPSASVQNVAKLLGDPFTITQESSSSALKIILDGSSGATSSSLTLSGSAEAFGTFSDDPFNLGSGILLSTGIATQLAGPNSSSGGGSNVATVPITFVKIGRTGDADIFRADLTGLDVDIRSIRLTDSGSGFGGAGGVASGFDLGAIALSTTKILNADGLDLDNAAILPRLNVFDFSNGSITFTPGTQHTAPSNFPYAADLTGAVNGLVDADWVRFDLFSGAFYNDAADDGTLTLGDGGSIGFDLTQPVSSEGPLYLYLAESGGSGEVITGAIDVSSDTIAPTGDLSTDLGAEGLEGDTTSLTYRFTPKAGDTGFSFDAIVFSEELPEFDGTGMTDLFSIKLNGAEIGTLSNDTALGIKSLVYSASGDLVFNPAGSGPLADTIRADAYTLALTISGALLPGVENVLTIEVADGRDAYLDSGILIKDGSFKTFVLPEFQVVLDGDPAAEPGDCVNVTISLPNGTILTDPVDVIVTPTGNLDLGGGAGKPVTITFDPAGPLTIDLCATVVPESDPDQDGAVTFTIDSDDAIIGGLGIPPIVIDVLPPTAVGDPALIFERLSGDLVEGFTTGNNTINATGLPGPSSFYVEGLNSGKDVIKGFGHNDILVVDEQIYDGNRDGFITFGKNNALDLDGPDSGIDTVRFLGTGTKSLRYLGTDSEGHFAYASASVRPKGAKESKLGNDTLAGDKPDKKADIFFFDTNLDMNLGLDTIRNFGRKDVITTTSALFDPEGDGRIDFGANGLLDLGGNSFFDPAHGGNQGDASPFGQVALFDIQGQAVRALYLDGTVIRNDVTYYVYSETEQPTPDLFRISTNASDTGLLL